MSRHAQLPFLLFVFFAYEHVVDRWHSYDVCTVWVQINLLVQKGGLSLTQATL